MQKVGIAPSIGSGRSTIARYKAALIKKRAPWRTPKHAEIATLEYIDWWNMRRLHTEISDIPPAEKEAMYYSEQERKVMERAVS